MTLKFKALSALSVLLLPALIGGCLPTSSGEETRYSPQIEQAGALLGYLEEREDRSSVTGPVPKRIAVLPATGQGDTEARASIRIAIHNHLSSLPFELAKPFQIDWELHVLEETQGLKAADASPAELARALGIGGLILVNVEDVERVYGLIYAHNQIELQVSFYSALAEKIIWEDSLYAVERSGGIFQTPLGFLATVFSSSTVLSEPVQLMLTEELGRKLSYRIPLPTVDQQRSLLPQIESAQSNAKEGPFRRGEEILVFATGEPGLRATFDLGSRLPRLLLTEREAGEYVGRYVVREGDDAQDIIPRLNFFKPSNWTRLEWHVPGPIVIDTRPPGEIVNLQARDTPAGLKLTWQSASDPRQPHGYRITRADSAVGRFEGGGETELNEFVDTQAQAGKRYHYRVQAVDAAGNEGPIATIQAAKPPLEPPPIATGSKGNLQEEED